MPIKSEKNNIGEYGKPLNFADVIFADGDYVYSDPDGIIISKSQLINETDALSNNSLPYIHVTYVKKMSDE